MPKSFSLQSKGVSKKSKYHYKNLLSFQKITIGPISLKTVQASIKEPSMLRLQFLKMKSMKIFVCTSISIKLTLDHTDNYS